MTTRLYSKLDDVEASVDAYINAADDVDRDRHFQAALAAMAMVLVEAMERVRTSKEVTRG